MMKEDLITTQPVSGGQWEYIAFIPGKEALAEGGDSIEEAIGRLWLASAGDMIATFLDIATQQNKIPNWPTILDIVETGIEGDKEGCRGYAELWLEKLQQDGETRIAQSLRRILEGRKGQVIHLAENQNDY